MEMDIIADNSEPPTFYAQPNKRSRKKSIVWEYFTIETIDASSTKACCKQCKKSFAYISGSKLAGTSHLRRHIVLGICPVIRNDPDKKHQFTPRTVGAKTNGVSSSAHPPRKRCRAPPVLPSFSFDQSVCNHELAKMVILHDYPLNIVQDPGFINFIRNLQPQFSMASFGDLQRDCVGIYLVEKQGIMNLLEDIHGRVSLSLDFWTSDQEVGFVFLTGHFVDADWKLCRRILNVVTVPSLESEVDYYHTLVDCLRDWNLDNKLFTLTLDPSFANVTARESLRGILSIKNPLILSGQLLVGNCYCRVLSRLAKYALETMKETVDKVRAGVKYVKCSETIEGKFNELKRTLQIQNSKPLTIDDQTKWNTTYHMLVSASEQKQVFGCLDTADPNYQITLSFDEWNQVETLCKYLKLFFDAANIFVSSSYPTTNTLFDEVRKIQFQLMHASMSQDPFTSNLVRPLQEVFDQYWNETSLILATAAVMDPRFKLQLIQFSFSQIYGEEAETWVKDVYEGIHELFLEYVVQALPSVTFLDSENDSVKLEVSEDGNFLSNSGGLSDFEVYIGGDITGNHPLKSELDQYLEEPVLPRGQDFDVLGWWKQRRHIYPTLSKMASDLLSIPVSTVTSDSVFDTGSKKMDSYRTTLRPETLEALICAKDWLQHGSSSGFSNSIIKMAY